MNKLESVLVFCKKAIYFIGTLTVGVMTILVTGAVILRYFFGISYASVEELITVMFCFTTFIGMGIAIVDGEHITVKEVVKNFPVNVRKIIDICIDILLIIMFIIIFKYVMIWFTSVGGQLSIAMQTNMLYLYVMVPISFVIALVSGVVRLFMDVKTPKEQMYTKKDEGCGL